MATVSHHTPDPASSFLTASRNNPLTLQQSQAWHALRIYFLYRFVFALFLSWSIYAEHGLTMIGSYDSHLFSKCLFAYTLLLGLSSIPLYQDKYAYHLHAIFHLTLDLICIPILIHASGGIGSGLDTLLLMSVAACGLLIGGLYAVGFASLCSLAFLGEVVYSDLYDIFETTRYTQASVLGICSFAVSLLAHSMGRRAEQSEYLANQHRKDIKRLEKLNAHIIQNLQSGIIIIDPAKGIQFINQSVLQFFALDTMPESLLTISEMLDQSYHQWLATPRQDSFVLNGEHEASILARIMTLDTEGKPYHLIWFEDLSVETQRIQQAKLASLGHLAASIAHEIRNPLTVISHASQLLEETSDLNEETLKLSQLIIRHTFRVNRIIDNILSLAQRRPACLEKIELKHWLQGFSVKFCDDYHLAHHQLCLDDHCIENAVIRVDPSQLKQVLSNLCSNAIKHSVASSRQRIELKINEDEDKIHIDVTNYGAKISTLIRDKLFEPFFTTSETGTGLGLYISKELAELNQGKLVYLPDSVAGNTFRLSFPKHRQQVISL